MSTAGMHWSSSLIGEVVVLLLLLRPQGVPPLAQDLGHRAVVLVRVLLVHQRPVSLAEDHEGVHRPPDPRLAPRLPVAATAASQIRYLQGVS